MLATERSTSTYELLPSERGIKASLTTIEIGALRQSLPQTQELKEDLSATKEEKKRIVVSNVILNARNALEWNRPKFNVSDLIPNSTVACISLNLPFFISCSVLAKH